ncbi:MAG: BamA/TamA family outer membrane protein [Gemmatimonadota bacterium]|nr:MAG: BamA/TamA family outer membrane protein [Gemmatimonadota bacterium]
MDFERPGGRRQHSLISGFAAGQIVVALAAALAPAASASTAPQLPSFAQDAPRRPSGSDWNSTRVRQLVERAIARRASWAAEGELTDYQAHASGHIYFLYDLGRGTERHLIKADQLALDLFWLAPDRTRQLIVGQRDKKVLPTDIRYHLDHLTVVMDNLGDRIRLGEGSEVRDALHPAAAEAPGFYDYRLADSVTLEMPHRQVRVYEVEVKPKDASGPGLVGTIYLDRATADIVRMDCTFTAASYLDETLDYFNIRLENALWEGRYWLPYRQGIELRREVEFVKFPAGGVIRAEFKISDYRFNTGIPATFFRGPSVTSLPEERRAAYEFDDGLYDALDPAVAVAPPSLEKIREQASRIVTEMYLQRAEGLRLAVPGISSVFRFRRAEGVYAGPGLGRSMPGGSRLLLGGYAFGAERGQVQGWARFAPTPSYEIELGGYYRRVADVSPWPASSGVTATLAALIDGEDYHEPYWASGGRLTLGKALGPARASVSVSWEDWELAALASDGVISRSYREVRELDAGENAALAVELEKQPVVAVEAVGGASWDVRVEAASHSIAGDFEYVHAAARAAMLWPDLVLGTGVRVSGAAGAVWGGGIPAQRLFPAGGRGTVRGYSFHRFVGNLYSAAGLELSRRIYHPFVSVALFADLGWVGIEGTGAARTVERWNRVGRPAAATDGALIGLGAGLGLVYDILRIEVARGLGEGGLWELVVRVRPDFWGWL